MNRTLRRDSSWPQRPWRSTACVKRQASRAQPPRAGPGASVVGRADRPRPARPVQRPVGRRHAPNPDAVYTLVERKHTGVNLGMTVKDERAASGASSSRTRATSTPKRRWKSCISRLLSAVGYHQPPVYHLPAFKLKDDFGTHVETGGRFRLKEESAEGRRRLAVGREPLHRHQALSGAARAADDVQQHRPEEQQQHALRAPARRSRRAVVLGPRRRRRARRHQPHLAAQGPPDSFERKPFILGVNNGYVEFAYKAGTRPRARPHHAGGRGVGEQPARATE